MTRPQAGEGLHCILELLLAHVHQRLLPAIVAATHRQLRVRVAQLDFGLKQALGDRRPRSASMSEQVSRNRVVGVDPDNIVAVSLDRTNNPNSYYGALTDTGVYYQFKESPAVVVAAVEGKLR